MSFTSHLHFASIMNSNILNIVHLSDLHIATGTDSKPHPRLERIVDTIRSHYRGGSLLIAFTGDIANAGKQEEYVIADNFLKNIVQTLKSEVEHLSLVCIPGNHDVDLDASTLRETLVQALSQSNTSTLPQLLELAEHQSSFFDFARNLPEQQASWDNRHAVAFQGHAGKYSYQVTCLNSATLSVRHEQPGTLALLPTEIPPRHNEVDLHIVLMHHPLHWLAQTYRSPMADWLSKTTELILTGHEHEHDQIEISRRNLSKTLFLPGQALYDPTSGDSGFQLLTVNLQTRQCVVKVLSYKDERYDLVLTSTHTLASSEERRVGLRQRLSFSCELESLSIGITHKSGTSITHSSIFIYPNLKIQPVRQSNSTHEHSEYIDAAQLANRILTEQVFLIIGEEASGKTFLCRQLVKDFLDKKLYPILVNAKSASSGTLLGLIEKAAAEQYDIQSSTDYFAVPKSERVLIVEDIDFLHDAHSRLDDFIKSAQVHFSCVVCSCNDVRLLQDPFGEDSPEVLWGMPRAVIDSLSHVKVSELVSRWVKHDTSLDQDAANRREIFLERSLHEVLALKAIPPQLMLLTLVLESIDLRDEVSEESGAYGYHYQRLILQAIAREFGRRDRKQTRLITEDILLELLGLIAYQIVDSGDNIDYETACDICRSMQQELLVVFPANIALSMLNEAGLLRVVEDGFVSFRYEYVRQFCYAKLLSLWLNKTHGRDKVNELVAGLVDTMHSSESASILIFFTYLTRDSATIDLIVDHSRAIFCDVPESDFGDSLDRLGQFNVSPSFELPASPNQYRRDLNRVRDERAKAQKEAESIAQTMKADFSITKQEFDRACQCIVVLGQVLRAYPTKLTGDEKRRVGTECYRLGLRTLSRFAIAAEASEKNIRHYFTKITSGYIDAFDVREFEVELGRHIAGFVQLSALAVVRRLARAVGSVHLSPLYSEIKIEGCERAVELVNRAIGLDLLNELKPGATAKLYRNLKSDDFRVATRVLQLLVIEYVLLHHVKVDTRQSLLRKLEMQEHPRMLMNFGRK
jgi:predicted MPP superfamily phosphohydrolase